MRRSSLGRPSPAMVVACLSLVVALTGTAIAAGIGKNSVGAKELGKVQQRTETVEPDLKNTAYAEATARCRSGEQLLGGGAVIDGNQAISSEDVLAESGPVSDRAWYARALVATVKTSLTVTAICLKK